MSTGLHHVHRLSIILPLVIEFVQEIRSNEFRGQNWWLDVGFGREPMLHFNYLRKNPWNNIGRLLLQASRLYTVYTFRSFVFVCGRYTSQACQPLGTSSLRSPFGEPTFLGASEANRVGRRSRSGATDRRPKRPMRDVKNTHGDFRGISGRGSWENLKNGNGETNGTLYIFWHVNNNIC